MATRRVVMVSTFPPRRCGLAEFTYDLRSAMIDVAPDWTTDVCALDRDGLGYGSAVLATVHQDTREDYTRALHDVARSDPDVVVIQHEFGIFGGPAGRYVLDLANGLRALGLPYVVTLHTVRPNPPRPQAETVRALCRDAALVTVFTRDARQVAAESGTADLARTVVVPHGAPAVLRERSGQPIGSALSQLLSGLAGARIIASFGLIKPAKGFEYVIQALPTITSRHPDVTYVIAGTTHPEVARLSGQRYRRQLIQLAADLSVARHVRFLDQFLTEAELSVLLDRADLYVTPYLSDEQASSGVLTFALAAGCPVVSTDYSYAREMLAPHAGVAPGVIVPCRDTAALASAISELLTDAVQLAARRAAAREFGATLMWPQVAGQFAAVFARASRGLRQHPFRSISAPRRPNEYGQEAGAASAPGDGR